MYLLETDLPVILLSMKKCKTLLPKAGAVKLQVCKDYTMNTHLSF